MQQNGKRNSQEHNRHNQMSRLAMIGEISAGIAHEVRNPLTSVKGFLQLLNERSPHHYLDLAMTELDRAIDTMQNLLQVSKPNLDDESYRPIHLCAEIETILYLFQNQMYDVEIVKKFRDTHKVFYGKKNQIKKALFNLVKNAFESIEGQGVVTIEHYFEHDRIHVAIHDTGVGIPEDKLNLIGTPFFSTKHEGTGMGLPQVFATVHEHGGTIDVQSEEGKGTSFFIVFPANEILNEEVTELDLKYSEGQSVKQFFEDNREEFVRIFEKEAAGTMDQLKKENGAGQYLMETIEKLMILLLDRQIHDIISHANEKGKTGAKNDIPIMLQLDWFQTFRKVFWDFLYNYYRHQEQNAEEFFRMEKNMNGMMNEFLNHYVASYTEHKDEILKSHREMIDDLSVPVIPISDTIAILPIVGAMDSYRAKKIQEKVLYQISSEKIKRIIIDLSGVAFMDTAVVSYIFRIIDGISLMGFKAVITGIRPEIANTMIELNISLDDRVETEHSLKQALEKFGSHLK